MLCISVPILGVQSDINEEGQKRGCKIPNHHFRESYCTVSSILVCWKNYSLYICISLWVCYIYITLDRYIMYTTRTRQIHVDALGKLINWHSFKLLSNQYAFNIYSIFYSHRKRLTLCGRKGGRAIHWRA